MSILIDHRTRLLVQGITGKEGEFHTQAMLDYGTNVVAGVTPGKGGEWVFNGKIPVFDSVKLAVEATGANASVIFVPARFAVDAMFEAADAGLPLIVCITEGVPVQAMMRVRNYLDQKGTRLVGPNCPGLLTPGQCKVGIIPGRYRHPRQCRRCITLRHADLRGTVRTETARDGRKHMRRDRRRSDQRDILPRHPRII